MSGLAGLWGLFLVGLAALGATAGVGIAFAAHRLGKVPRRSAIAIGFVLAPLCALGAVATAFTDLLGEEWAELTASPRRFVVDDGIEHTFYVIVDESEGVDVRRVDGVATLEVHDRFVRIQPDRDITHAYGPITASRPGGESLFVGMASTSSRGGVQIVEYSIEGEGMPTGDQKRAWDAEAASIADQIAAR